MPDGDYWIKTSRSGIRKLHFVHHGGKAWAMVVHKKGSDSRFYTTGTVLDGGSTQEPDYNNNFKLRRLPLQPANK